ncbi:hypothetical protein DUF583 [Psychromonas ingrahamii 37]|uniref:Polymer-forming cytoskeletal protein n=1 Tax=Psychromonas ingrahamii (strain DSM 17664 / CCUG 51855 / 37) TaxID=357804 RepID=A1SV38_PSYIN|nr:polymer-forming cytoskeletal protein [Psychromonas ingrahamii]ABM03353.1 hypothetical protein DUF583 [Psychromonas ingrahamii 37]
MGLFSSKTGTTDQHSTATVIATGCSITGTVQLACDIQIDGEVEGKIISEKSIVISHSGKVKGEVYANNVIINGTLEGTVHADSIEILEKGQINGSIYTDKLSIDKGGLFLGNTNPRKNDQVTSISSNEKEMLIKPENKSSHEKEMLIKPESKKNINK